MQELRVIRWCDECWANGDQKTGLKVEATERYTIVIDPDRSHRIVPPRILDLCEVHSKPVEELRSQVVKLGVATPPKDAKEAKVTPIKGGKAEPKVAPGSAPTSPAPALFPREAESPPKKRAKVAKVAKAKVPLRGDCPIEGCGVNLARSSAITHLVLLHGGINPGQPKQCPDCDLTFGDKQSMVTHRRRAHGYDHVAAVLATVPKKGRAR